MQLLYCGNLFRKSKRVYGAGMGVVFSPERSCDLIQSIRLYSSAVPQHKQNPPNPTVTSKQSPLSSLRPSSFSYRAGSQPASVDVSAVQGFQGKLNTEKNFLK